MSGDPENHDEPPSDFQTSFTEESMVSSVLGVAKDCNTNGAKGRGDG